MSNAVVGGKTARRSGGGVVSKALAKGRLRHVPASVP